MISKDDWRLTSQENYLKSVELIKSFYKPKGNNDHTHCCFCWEKFMEDEGFLHEGYCTLDRYHWICPTCFNDFKEMFNWEVVE